MAEATTEITVTPKQLGKHLRTVRRKKGLSLSEVARGAGLSRRELVNYERGKLPIPESDLWVLAGSCGVDVAELMPTTTSQELVPAGAPATSIGDTVTQLRKHHEDRGITPYLGTLHKLQALPPGKRVPVKERELDAIATALGGTPASVEQKLQDVLQVSPEEAKRLRTIIVAPPGGRGKLKAIAAADVAPTPQYAPVADRPVAEAPAPEPIAAEPVVAPPMVAEAPSAEAPAAAFPTEPMQTFPVAPAAFLDAPLDAATGHNVDVFEELARLPEPLPLGDPSAPLPDLLAAPGDGFDDDPFAAAGPLVPTPLNAPPDGAVELVDAGPGALPSAFALAADAPPIDVAMRQGSDRWDWGEAPAASTTTPTESDAPSWESAWQPPTPPGGDAGTPSGFWEGTDDWIPVDPAAPADAAATNGTNGTTGLPADLTEPVDAAPAETVIEPAVESPWITDWDPQPAADLTAPAVPVDVNPWTADEWPRELAGDEGPWEHEPDPEAVSTGFYVDWGTPDTELPEPAAEPTTEPAWDAAPGWDPEPTWDTAPTWDAEPTWEPAPVLDVLGAAVAEVVTEPAVTEPDPWADDEPDALPPISWRADGPAALPAPAAVEPAEDDPEPFVESFVTAGSDWELGNALPLVEVQAKGALVMRRADERWALADVTTAPDFVVEVDVDFRSGPGLGVLFRASLDDEGRMSGYSFDIDPIYDGGGYLVRQWQADRELWNPIARVSAADPSAMHGTLTVRLVVTGEQLVALVNGTEVLTVESLKQASVDRGREGASGDRVGVQAWSSSDLVIDTLRVAQI